MPAKVAQPVIAVVDKSGDGATVLRLVALDGPELAHVVLPSGASVVGTGGGVAAFIVNGELEGLHQNGTVEKLGPAAGYSAGPIIVSPDAQQWMWSVWSGSGATVASRVVLGTRNAPDRTVARMTSTTARVLMPYRWTPGGPVYQSSPLGLGGYILFALSFGPSWRFDSASGKVTQLTDSCRIADVALGGATACLRDSSPGNSTLDVATPGASVLHVALPRPEFTQVGAVSFRPAQTSTLVVSGATGVGADGEPEHYQSYLVDVATGHMRSFGLAGLRAGDGSWTWLADGSLIAYRPARAFGGEPGIYLVTADGASRKVFGSGMPIGVITV
ncbi:MAG: hypothetical protein M3024_12180 [Candidatus Dormibacteraeota bacterium]|nr:hypothetical protein [Candidatus Dormibacteraeota bacterium]